MCMRHMQKPMPLHIVTCIKYRYIQLRTITYHYMTLQTVIAIPLEDLALVVSPVAEEDRPNDPDLCGFYFFPYELAEWTNAQFGGFQVSIGRPPAVTTRRSCRWAHSLFRTTCH